MIPGAAGMTQPRLSGCGENRRCEMAKSEAVFIYVGTYPSEAVAEADYEVVKDLHAVGAVGTYDAAVVTQDDAGKVHENKDVMAEILMSGARA
jgi:uncharacterized membrane protein